MKKLVMTFLVGSTGWLQAQAQTALTTSQQVFDNYVTAIGGKEALTKVNDLTMTMSADMGGNALLMTRKQKLPNKFSMVVNMMGMEVMKQTSDGSKVQVNNIQTGSQMLEGPDAQLMIAASTLFHEMHATETGLKSELAGTEKVNGKDAYKITNTLGEASWTDFYDVASGLKVQAIVKTPQGSQTSLLSDYKEVDGIKFPFTVSTQTPRGPMTMTVDDVKINKGLKDADFIVK